MNFQQSIEEPLNEFDPLEDVSKIPEVLQGYTESQDLFGDSLENELQKRKQEKEQNEDQEVKILEDTIQLLMEFIRCLLSLNIGFQTYIQNFQMPSNFNDESSEDILEKDSVDLVYKLRGLVLNPVADGSISKKGLNDFCREFFRMKSFVFLEGKKANLKKMLALLLKMIGIGLSIGNKEQSKNFQKLLIGKVRNEYVQAKNGGKFIIEKEEDFEPVSLCKFKAGFEVSLHHAFNLNKVFLASPEDEKLEEFTQVIWISEPPDILLFVFTDDEESQNNVEGNKFFTLPNKLTLDAFLEKNAYKVRLYQKKEKEALEAERKKMKQQMKSNKELEDLSQRKLPEEDCQEVYILKQVLVSEEGKISGKEINTKNSQLLPLWSPICAFYLKQNIDNLHQSDLQVKEAAEKDKKEKVENSPKIVRGMRKRDKKSREELKEEIKEERFSEGMEIGQLRSWNSGSQGNPINEMIFQRRDLKDAYYLFQAFLKVRETGCFGDHEKLFGIFEFLTQEDRMSSEKSLMISNLFLCRFEDIFDALIRSDNQLEPFLMALDNYLTLKELKATQSVKSLIYCLQVEGYFVEGHLKDFSEFVYQVLLLQAFGSLETLFEKSENIKVKFAILEFLDILDLCWILTWNKLNLKHQNQLTFCVERIKELKTHLGFQPLANEDKLEKMLRRAKDRNFKTLCDVKSFIKDPTEILERKRQFSDSKTILHKYSSFLSSYQDWICCEVTSEKRFLQLQFEQCYKNYKTINLDSIPHFHNEFEGWLSSCDFFK